MCTFWLREKREIYSCKTDLAKLRNFGIFKRDSGNPGPQRASKQKLEVK